jgi:hypothetical protein
MSIYDYFPIGPDRFLTDRIVNENIRPGPNVIQLFTSVIYEFS